MTTLPPLRDPGFIHLRARSDYSLLQSTLDVKKLVKLAVAQGMPALGLTDSNNLFGALEFSELCAEKGVQPIIGCTLTVEAGPGQGGSLAVLAQSERGYGALMRLSSKAFLSAASPSEARITLQDLLDDPEGLICLTGGAEGLIGQVLLGSKPEEAGPLLQTLAAVFGDRLYVELQRHGAAEELACEQGLIDLAYKYCLPLVASTDIRFARPADHAAHDALMCIAGSTYVAEADRARVTPDHWFSPPARMAETFSDLPEALAASVEIAQRCCYRPLKRDPILPRFTSDAGRDEPAELTAQAEQGLKDRLAELGGDLAVPEQEYWDRLRFELFVIIQMKFPGYFLIVADFIKWAKARGIPVGPGRGSGAGSLVAWALTITDLDPLRYGLLFERFLNPERVSMPDFDIDFCQERREEVIEYVRAKYGDDRVAQIITFGTLQARAVLRDVGRVLQMPFTQVDRLAKLVPANPANPVTLAKALEIEPKLAEARAGEQEVADLLDVALQLEGLHRNASTHAAGIVIGDRPLIELVPLYRDPRSPLPATQFNMKWVEPAGLVKFDFLGLKTLTVIDRAVKYLALRGISINPAKIPFDDDATYALLASGATYGVFQLESQGMRDTLRKVKPNKVEDIIALISLYRPGPMDNIDGYAAVKAGRDEPDYPHPSIIPILEETYGVIIYQEQVMQIAQVLSGYSLGEADMLRRAMGKKKPEEMAKQKSRFIAGAMERQVDPGLADRIFELLEKFAGYGFNKSHAAAYAAVALQTAYIKAHYPVEFIAASMSLDIANSDKLAAFAQDARRMGVKILPPCINQSGPDFTVSDGAIRYALGAVRNVGLSAMQAVCAVRQAGGPFKDLFDLGERIDPKVINRRQLENLAKAGAFDTLEADRARALASCETIMAMAQRVAEDRASAQASLFGAEEPAAKPVLPKAPAWSQQVQLDSERESIGFYLSGHPLADFFGRPNTPFVTYLDLIEDGETETKVYPMAGVLRAIKARPAQSGGQLAYAAFSDPTGEYEAMIMPEHYAAHRDVLKPGKAFVFRTKVRWREGDMRLSADTFEPLEAAEARGLGPLVVTLREGAPVAILAQTLQQLSARATGGDQRPLRLVLRLRDGREIELAPPGLFPAGPQARAAIKAAQGVERVA